jgi:hypothetical protein
MEDVLEVYQRPRDPNRPLVCLDETSKQLIAETRAPIKMKKGQKARFDYEYERNGTANLFMMFAPLEGWRHVKVTDRHTAVDYAGALKDLADIHFPKAKKIVLVQDNLNTHTKASLYEAFPAAEARRLANVSNFTTRQSTEAGSTWPSPNSASSLHNVSTAASRTRKSSSKKSSLGRAPEINITPRQIGNSQPKTPASNLIASTLNLSDSSH